MVMVYMYVIQIDRYRGNHVDHVTAEVLEGLNGCNAGACTPLLPTWSFIGLQLFHCIEEHEMRDQQVGVSFDTFRVNSRHLWVSLQALLGIAFLAL